MGKIISPYIGITGFTKPWQVSKLLEEVPENCNRKIMIGVLVNHNNINNPFTTTRCVKLDDIKSIFTTDPRVLNVVHYCNEDKKNMFDDLEALIELGGPNIHGFQPNMRWPNWIELKEFKEKHPNILIVLQMEKNDFIEFNPEEMASGLMYYINTADYVILDASMGAGIELDPKKLMEYAYPISLTTGFNIVFAGGLNSLNINILKPIIKQFKNASIDAEGRLMGSDDALDIQKTCSYLQAALKLFQI